MAIDKQGEPYLIVLRLNGELLECIEWDGSHYSIEKKVALDDVPPSDIYITHYYGLSEVKYFGVTDFAIGRTTLWPYMKIHVAGTLSNVDQYFFNKRKLVTKQRVDLLRFLVSQNLEGKSTFETLDLMTELYSIKWVLHPNSESQHQKLEFYLESLVDTGELKRINDKFALTGYALKAIEEYEEQERKHTENVKLQRQMVFLTVAIVLLTAVQAGLIKLPALIDLSLGGTDSKTGIPHYSTGPAQRAAPSSEFSR